MKINIVIAFVVLAAQFIMSGIGHAAPRWNMVGCNVIKKYGDCHVLEDQGVIALVDAGEEIAAKNHLVPFLKRKGIKKVNHFFISHPHTDHYQGLEALIKAGVFIENIYYNKPPEGVSDWNYKPEVFQDLLGRLKNRGSTIKNVEKGDVIKLPTSKITILEATKERQRSVNDYSIIMRWEAGGYSSLFTGDLDERLGQKLINDPLFRADFYKAPHHAVTPVAPDAFSNAVNPALMMASTSKFLWDHPRGAQFKRWANSRKQSHNMMTCVDGINGNVTLSFEQDSVWIQAEKSSQLCSSRRLYLKAKELVRVAPNNVDISPIINYLLTD